MTTPLPDELVGQADFVFNGTVEEVGASTMSSVVAASDRTAVVRVDDLVRAPSTFTGLRGQRITVLLVSPASVQQGEQATFFTNGLAFGRSIAVAEIEHRDVAAIAGLRAQAAEATDRARETEVTSRITSAECVVEARVAQVRTPTDPAVAEPGLPGPMSEHYPDWREALLDVQSVIKGTRPQNPTVLLFPASIDIMWVNAPKFHAGQEGFWFLHAESVPSAAARAYPSVYTALDAHDFQPSTQSARIRGLVAELGG
jgi:hypothetical protein